MKSHEISDKFNEQKSLRDSLQKLATMSTLRNEIKENTQNTKI